MGGFGQALESAVLRPEAQAASLETAFSQGEQSAPIGEVMAKTSQAALQAEEFSLMVSKAMSAYQSIMAMQV